MTSKCKVCEGEGYVEGIKCFYCVNGYYHTKKETPQEEYEDPPCGEIIEIDV